jgi:hypothetical protein
MLSLSPRSASAQRWAAIIALGLALGCNGASGLSAGDGTSGIKGDVTLGPLRPVERPGEVNSRPLADAPVVVHPCLASRPALPGPDQCTDVADRIAGRATSDKDGRFSVSLAPGRYVVYGEKIGGAALPRPPQSADVVAVTRGAFAHVTLAYDTGIR